MNKNLYLIVSFEDFKSQLNQKVFDARDIYEILVNTPEEFEDFKQRKKTWENESLAILNNSFNELDNEYAEDFRYANGNSFNIPGVQKNLKQLIDNQKETLQYKQKSIWDTIRLVEVSDAIARRDTTDLDARLNYTTDEKLHLILDKLYLLYDDSYYPIRAILEGNGIILKRYDDDREFVKM